MIDPEENWPWRKNSELNYTIEWVFQIENFLNDLENETTSKTLLKENKEILICEIWIADKRIVPVCFETKFEINLNIDKMVYRISN